MPCCFKHCAFLLVAINTHTYLLDASVESSISQLSNSPIACVLKPLWIFHGSLRLRKTSRLGGFGEYHTIWRSKLPHARSAPTCTLLSCDERENEPDELAFRWCHFGIHRLVLVQAALLIKDKIRADRCQGAWSRSFTWHSSTAV